MKSNHFIPFCPRIDVVLGLFVLGFLATAGVGARAQALIVPLWPEGAPGSEGWTQVEADDLNPWDGFRVVKNVTNPMLDVYLPDPARATGAGVLVAPGGAFHFLAIETEGVQLAEWLLERGIATFMLKYRLVETPADPEGFRKVVTGLFGGSPAPREDMARVTALAVQDGLRALEIIRNRAEEWKVSPDRVGMLGFSAGARVTAGVALESPSGSRPAFVAPIYGGMWGEFTVPSDAPPLFLMVAQNDPLAAATVLDLYSAWTQARRSAELHVYSTGGHGFGMRKQGTPSDTWVERFGDWLGAIGMLHPTK